MYELLLAAAVVLFALVKARERFGLVIGSPDYITTNTETDKGLEIFSTTPNTCPPEKPELDAGLCYKRCNSGFHGVGPVCWADSQSVGVGRPVGLEPCPAGWSNDGLICREPLRWNSCKFRGLFKECWGGLEGGRLKGRLNSGGICDWPQDRGNLPGHLVDKSDPKNYKATHPDKVDGLCYKKCPPELPARIPGMPYLCYKGGPLSYGRGVGAVPSLLRIGRKFNPF
jgi:hypothetical protein